LGYKFFALAVFIFAFYMIFMYHVNMKTQKAYKYRFYPTDEQAEQLAHTFGCVRYTYNYFLRQRQDAWYSRQEKMDYHATSAMLTVLKKQPDHFWLKKVSAVPLQQALRHLHAAFLNFWAGRAKYPNFKKKSHRQSATYASSAFKWDGENLKLAKQKEPLDIRWSRPFNDVPSTVIVSKDSAERYFVSILVEEDIQSKKILKKEIGVDLGIKDVLVSSDGFKSGSPKYTRKYEKKLAKAQRSLSKKKKGSQNRAKAKLKVAKVHAKIADCRRDFTHQLTTKLINENQVIAVETLAVKNMIRNRCLSKSIADSNWGELLRQLEYKASWYGRELIGIDRWHPSSKRCFDCGWINDDLRLSDRIWVCEECGSNHDRDINAARNILAAGLAVSAFGENVNLASVSDISCSR
jgi:putative transposase